MINLLPSRADIEKSANLLRILSREQEEAPGSKGCPGQTLLRACRRRPSIKEHFENRHATRCDARFEDLERSVVPLCEVAAFRGAGDLKFYGQ